MNRFWRKRGEVKRAAVRLLLLPVLLLGLMLSAMPPMMSASSMLSGSGAGMSGTGLSGAAQIDASQYGVPGYRLAICLPGILFDGQNAPNDNHDPTRHCKLCPMVTAACDVAPPFFEIPAPILHQHVIFRSITFVSVPSVAPRDVAARAPPVFLLS